MCACSVTTVTPWAVFHRAPLSMGFSSKNTRVGCRQTESDRQETTKPVQRCPAWRMSGATDTLALVYIARQAALLVLPLPKGPDKE